MPSILIIAYYFPPWGMGGVQRVAKFAKYLPEFGWDVTVIAPHSTQYHQQDASLLDDLPKSIRVERIQNRDSVVAAGRSPIGPIRPILRWLSSWRDFPDRHRSFASLAATRAQELMRERHFDIVFTSSPPPSVHLSGLTLKNEIPWIADFRDPWQALSEDYGPTPVHRRINCKTHRRILVNAAAVTTVTPELSLHFAYLSPAARIETIRNGYDESDFSGHDSPSRSSDELVIVFPGTFSVFSDPSPAFHAIASWRKADPGRKLKILHVGATHGIDIDRHVKTNGLADVYSELGYLDHSRAIAEMMKADLLMLAYNDSRVTNLSVPGRIYELLRTLRPIVAFTPAEGALAALLRPIPGCMIIAPDAPDAHGNSINLALNSPTRPLESIRQFGRRTQAEQLSALCHNVIDEKVRTRR